MKRENQKGIILILSLMIMSVLLSIALGFGIFILSDLRQAKEIDDSVMAYYAADSGIERTLYLFRKEDKDKIDNFSGNDGALSAGDREDDIDGDGDNDWSIAGSTDYEPVFFRQRIFNGQSIKFYFLGRNAGSNASESIKLEWFKGLNSPKLQIILTQLTPTLQDGVLVYFTDTDKVEISDTTELSNPICFDFKDKDPQGSTLLQPSDYMVEVRVVGTSGDYVDNISVTAHDEGGGLGNCDTASYNDSYNQGAISNITIKSVGTYHNVRQEVFVQIPPRNPVSGILGFVLFSQEDITKGY